MIYSIYVAVPTIGWIELENLMNSVKTKLPMITCVCYAKMFIQNFFITKIDPCLAHQISIHHIYTVVYLLQNGAQAGIQ